MKTLQQQFTDWFEDKYGETMRSMYKHRQEHGDPVLDKINALHDKIRESERDMGKDKLDV